jgi:acetyl-CoA acetyltransferase
VEVSDFPALPSLSHSVLTLHPSPDIGPAGAADDIKRCGPASDALQPMGWTSENVAGEFNISREDMDDFAAKSFQRAEAADRAGYFAKEIVPFTSYQKDSATGARKKVTVSKDDGIRYGTTKATLLKIKSAFPQWPPSQTTGGNASQITDGAAAVLLMTRQKADDLGLRILSKYVNVAVTGELGPWSDGLLIKTCAQAWPLASWALVQRLPFQKSWQRLASRRKM